MRSGALSGSLPFGARLAGRMRQREVQAQIVFCVLLAALVWGFIQAASGIEGRGGAQSGFGFLREHASFELGESLIPFQAGDTYFRAFLVGLLNTVKVAVCGIILSTILGLVIALGQLSPSILAARLCRLYVEVFRNMPLLLQLIFWHTFLLRGLPAVRQALSPVEGVYLTNRGLYVPAIAPDPAYLPMLLALVAGLALSILLRHMARQRDGVIAPKWRLAMIFGPPLAVFLAYGAPFSLDMPALAGFNFKGGWTLTPEFAAMVIGLTLYTAAFNAEIIRAGIQGVAKGQTEAGLSLGLRRSQIMRLIVIPQTFRIITPPMTNSYLSLTKESSLAVAIGYPEVVRVANITLSETNRSIECIALIMIIYLMLSLLISALLNVVNARVQMQHR
ncbi:amino acid ABC transporter permease [Albibacillus kandeliae]|uniref:amino acid ABC transporter permease n=1 Tax=Albibacillus kandeliae TaxID=2174228 RepID=UPI000D689CE4|nr:ABC transporter permease subunit [Albibacillus kandeliae]